MTEATLANHSSWSFVPIASRSRYLQQLCKHSAFTPPPKAQLEKLKAVVERHLHRFALREAALTSDWN